ncbi:MAG: type II toxin-antitoxin system VapC family toxin [bacterium]|nr:type II toxin-antitoxin system VapC family toxin [bacterium]
MTKCFLDANILVYLKDEVSDHHRETIDLISKLITNEIKLFVSPLCLDEIVHSLNYILKRDFKKLKVVMDDIFNIPTLEIINPPADIEENKKVITLMENYSLRPRDAYHLLTMQANKIDGFATFDNDFHKVFAAKILQKA